MFGGYFFIFMTFLLMIHSLLFASTLTCSRDSDGEGGGEGVEGGELKEERMKA